MHSILQRSVDYHFLQTYLTSPERIRSWNHQSYGCVYYSPIERLGEGEITQPSTYDYKNFKPTKWGLFCDVVFGELNDKQSRRSRPGYIKLASPTMHVWFLKNATSYVAVLTNRKRKYLEKLVYAGGFTPHCNEPIVRVPPLFGILSTDKNNFPCYWSNLVDTDADRHTNTHINKDGPMTTWQTVFQLDGKALQRRFDWGGVQQHHVKSLMQTKRKRSYWYTWSQKPHGLSYDNHRCHAGKKPRPLSLTQANPPGELEAATETKSTIRNAGMFQNGVHGTVYGYEQLDFFYEGWYKRITYIIDHAHMDKETPPICSYQWFVDPVLFTYKKAVPPRQPITITYLNHVLVPLDPAVSLEPNLKGVDYWYWFFPIWCLELYRMQAYGSSPFLYQRPSYGRVKKRKVDGYRFNSTAWKQFYFLAPRLGHGFALKNVFSKKVEHIKAPFTPNPTLFQRHFRTYVGANCDVFFFNNQIRLPKNPEKGVNRALNDFYKRGKPKQTLNHQLDQLKQREGLDEETKALCKQARQQRVLTFLNVFYKKLKQRQLLKQDQKTKPPEVKLSETKQSQALERSQKRKENNIKRAIAKITTQVKQSQKLKREEDLTKEAVAKIAPRITRSRLLKRSQKRTNVITTRTIARRTRRIKPNRSDLPPDHSLHCLPDEAKPKPRLSHNDHYHTIRFGHRVKAVGQGLSGEAYMFIKQCLNLKEDDHAKASCIVHYGFQRGLSDHHQDLFNLAHDLENVTLAVRLKAACYQTLDNYFKATFIHHHFFFTPWHEQSRSRSPLWITAYRNCSIYGRQIWKIAFNVSGQWWHRQIIPVQTGTFSEKTQFCPALRMRYYYTQPPCWRSPRNALKVRKKPPVVFFVKTYLCMPLGAPKQRVKMSSKHYAFKTRFIIRKRPYAQNPLVSRRYANLIRVGFQLSLKKARSLALLKGKSSVLHRKNQTNLVSSSKSEKMNLIVCFQALVTKPNVRLAKDLTSTTKMETTFLLPRKLVHGLTGRHASLRQALTHYPRLRETQLPLVFLPLSQSYFNLNKPKHSKKNVAPLITARLTKRALKLHCYNLSFRFDKKRVLPQCVHYNQHIQSTLATGLSHPLIFVLRKALISPPYLKPWQPAWCRLSPMDDITTVFSQLVLCACLGFLRRQTRSPTVTPSKKPSRLSEFNFKQFKGLIGFSYLPQAETLVDRLGHLKPASKSASKAPDPNIWLKQPARRLRLHQPNYVSRRGSFDLFHGIMQSHLPHHLKFNLNRNYTLNRHCVTPALFVLQTAHAYDAFHEFFGSIALTRDWVNASYLERGFTLPNSTTGASVIKRQLDHYQHYPKAFQHRLTCMKREIAMIDYHLPFTQKVLYFLSAMTYADKLPHRRFEEAWIQQEKRFAREYRAYDDDIKNQPEEEILKHKLEETPDSPPQLAYSIYYSTLALTRKLAQKHRRRLRLVRILKMLHPFAKTQVQPSWMVLTLLPVCPPDMRPMITLNDQQMAVSDLNKFYQEILFRRRRQIRTYQERWANTDRHFMLNNPRVSPGYEDYSNRVSSLPYVRFLQRATQQSVDNLMENGKSGATPLSASNDRPLKSLSDNLKGKQGRFRQNLLGKRVDYSGRSVIVVGPELKLHECGLPKEMAVVLFQNHLIRTLLRLNKHYSYANVKKMIQKRHPHVMRVLEKIVESRPVLLNRAPTLHRLGIQAFKAKLVSGRAILLHPLVCGAFNADFDGDQMAVHLPLTPDSSAEAWKLMWSCNHLRSVATGDALLVPSQDMVLGCYYLTSWDGLTRWKQLKQHCASPDPVFSDLSQIAQTYAMQKVTLHRVIWLKALPVFELSRVQPCFELQIHHSGMMTYLHPDYKAHHTKTNCLPHYFIKTTVGRALAHQSFSISLSP